MNFFKGKKNLVGVSNKLVSGRPILVSYSGTHRFKEKSRYLPLLNHYPCLKLFIKKSHSACKTFKSHGANLKLASLILTFLLFSPEIVHFRLFISGIVTFIIWEYTEYRKGSSC